MENSTFTAENISPFLATLRVIDAIVLMTITVIGVVGNTLVFIAYCVSYKIRTKTNIFVINLAAADFMTCSLLPIVSWSLLIKVDGIAHWLDVLCGFTIGAIQAFASCSIMMLASIAANRFVLITRSRETYKSLYQNKFIAVWLILSWTYPVLVVTVPLLFGVGHLGFDPEIHACGARADNPRSYLYDAIVVGIVIPLPAVVTIYCYGGIYFYIKSHNRNLEGVHRRPNFINTAYNISRMNQNPETSSQARVSKQQVDITKNLFYILVTFVICLTPHMISELANAHHLLILHTKILVAFNSCVNPILYGAKHPHFRHVFKCIIYGRWGEIPEPTFRWMNAQPSRSTNYSQRNIDRTAPSLSTSL